MPEHYNDILVVFAILMGGAAMIIVGVVLAGAFRDRSGALKLAEEQERRYMFLFDNSPDMVFCFDTEENRIVSANPSVYRVTGYSPEKPALPDLCPPYNYDSEMDAVREQCRHSAERNQSRNSEVSIMGKDGRQLQIGLTVFPLDFNGKRYIYAIGRDMTDRNKAEEKLIHTKEEAERANRIKGEFLAIMSHEIRTPLNGMIGINQIMMETELNDKQREMMLVQERSGQALLRVINDVLDFSKIEAGTVMLSDDLFYLEGTMQECVELFVMAARTKGIELSYRIDGDIPEMVHGDPVRLRQILMNLVGNAVKFTESGSVLLEARMIDHPGQAALNEALLEFKVTDTGIGIDPAKVHLLFLPFSQILDASKGRNYEGTGLGLAICRDLVELMGGKIWVEPGRKRGAAFGIRIPFKMREAEENVS